MEVFALNTAIIETFPVWFELVHDNAKKHSTLTQKAHFTLRMCSTRKKFEISMREDPTCLLVD